MCQSPEVTVNNSYYSGGFQSTLTPKKYERMRNIENKDVRIVSRMSEAEKKKIESIAEKCGLSTSEYVRKRALGYEPKEVLPCAFFDFYEKLCEVINLPFDSKSKNIALHLFDEIHNEFFREEKQSVNQIRKEVIEWQPQDSGP